MKKKILLILTTILVSANLAFADTCSDILRRWMDRIAMLRRDVERAIRFSNDPAEQQAMWVQFEMQKATLEGQMNADLAAAGCTSVTPPPPPPAPTIEPVPPIPDGKPILRGDANGDGKIDISDVVVIGKPSYRKRCPKAADINDDGKVDTTDARALAEYLFNGGPAPAGPFPNRGVDPTPDGLGCE